MAAAAEKCLNESISKELAKKDKATWRLQPAVRDLLLDFASKSDWDSYSSEVLAEVQETLFTPLNELLWLQETSLDPEIERMGSLSGDQVPCVHVIFGGKFAPSPSSISERMVSLLMANDRNEIITVSRSQQSGIPNQITHIAKQGLDQPGGDEHFLDVLEIALKRNKPLTIYFTLAQHRGVNPFQRNRIAAENFVAAMRKCSTEALQKAKIVITGTDATLPSTTEGSTLQVSGQSYTVPTYKIGVGNFTYAMSKLYQFYIIAEGLCEIHGKDTSELKKKVDMMNKDIQAYGEDYAYDPNRGMSMEMLDEIAKEWLDLMESKTIPHLKVATGISICYTPLHRNPWVQASFPKKDEAHGSPRGYLLQQIVRRLKNAISVDMAARKHLVQA